MKSANYRQRFWMLMVNVLFQFLILAFLPFKTIGALVAVGAYACISILLWLWWVYSCDFLARYTVENESIIKDGSILGHSSGAVFSVVGNHKLTPGAENVIPLRQIA